MNNWPRVAFFSDSYHGVDGVATTCRNIALAARRQNLPFLSVRAGEKTRWSKDGSLEILELDQGPWSFNYDKHLKFDLMFLRHYGQALDAVREFRPDVIHITGPGDVGIMGARVAFALELPLVASWHTNLHEYAARRLWKMAEPLPGRQRRALANLTEDSVLSVCLRFYEMANVLLAPNREMVESPSPMHKETCFPYA